MKQPRLPLGEKVCIIVATMVTKHPIPMPHRRPRKSAWCSCQLGSHIDTLRIWLTTGPPMNQPDTIAPMEYTVLINPSIYVESEVRPNQSSQLSEPWTELNVEASYP